MIGPAASPGAYFRSVALPPARYVSVAAAVALLSLLRPATCPAADSLPAHGLMRLQRPGSGPMLDVAVSPDGSTLATATARGDVQLWRSSDGGMRTLLRAEAPADAVAFSADGTRLVATYADGTVRLWDARDGSMVRRLLVHPRGARVAVLSPDGHVVAGGGADGAIHLVEAETGNPVRRIEPVADENANVRAARPAAVRALAFSPDGSILAAGYERFNSSVRVWDPQTGREVARLNEDGDRKSTRLNSSHLTQSRMPSSA